MSVLIFSSQQDYQSCTPDNLKIPDSEIKSLEDIISNNIIMKNIKFNTYESIDTLNKALAFKTQCSNTPNNPKMNKISQKERNRRSLGIPNRNFSYSLVINNNNHDHKNLFEYCSLKTNKFNIKEWEKKLSKSSMKIYDNCNCNYQRKSLTNNSQCDKYIKRYIFQNSKFPKMKEILCKMHYNFQSKNRIRSERSIKGNHDIQIQFPENLQLKSPNHSSNKLDKIVIIDKNEVKRIFKFEEFKKTLKFDLVLDNIKLKRENNSLTEKKSQEKSKSEPGLKSFQNEINYKSNSPENLKGNIFAFNHWRTREKIARRINFNG